MQSTQRAEVPAQAKYTRSPPRVREKASHSAARGGEERSYDAPCSSREGHDERQEAAPIEQNPSLTRQAASVDESSMAAPLASGASDHVVATSAPPLATQSTLALALPAIPSPLTMPPTLALPEHVPQQQRSESSTRAIADTHDDAQATEADTTGATCECLPRDPTKWMSFNNAQSVQVWQCDDCGEQWEW